MKYLLDTDTCVAILRKNQDVINKLMTVSPEDCGVSIVTVFELYSGVEKAREVERERLKVDRFLKVASPLDWDQTAAKMAAKARGHLEKKGMLIGPYDLLIAGHAMSRQLILVTNNNKEFSRVPELRLENWIHGSHSS